MIPSQADKGNKIKKDIRYEYEGGRKIFKLFLGTFLGVKNIHKL